MMDGSTYDVIIHAALIQSDGWIRLGIEPDENRVCVRVRDNGPGIPAEYRGGDFREVRTG